MAEDIVRKDLLLLLTGNKIIGNPDRLWGAGMAQEGSGENSLGKVRDSIGIR